MYRLRNYKIGLSLMVTLGLVSTFGTVAQAQTTNTLSTDNTRLIENTVKYRDAGARPATGRAGTATLSARALLNKDNSTDLEVTTGTLDSEAPAPGNISKVQIKSFDQNDHLRYTRNFNGLSVGGTFKLRMTDVFHAQPLQVQANVRGIDGNRTNVVTMIETVKLRPDLKASDLVAPGTGILNAPVNIAATISEMNREVGARADVVLYVDGVEADRSNGIWVDAQGAVTAAFTQQFPTAGTKQLEIKVENVKPGDYDTQNNSVAGSIEIKSPGNPFRYYYMSGHDVTSRYSGKRQGFYRYDPAGAYNDNSDWDFQWGHSGRYQHTYFHAWHDEYKDFPFTVSVTEMNDGTAVLSSVVTSLNSQHANSYNNGAFTDTFKWARIFDSTTYGYIYVWNLEGVDNSSGNRLHGQTGLEQYRYAGDVTYFSRGYQIFWGNNSDGQPFHWSWNRNYDSHNPYGNFINFGSEYGFEASLASADGTAFTLSQVRPTVPFAHRYQQAFTCRDWDFSGHLGFPYYGRECYEDDQESAGKSFSGAFWEDIAGQ